MIRESNKRIEATEFIACAQCNMSCRYCYIIKNEKLTKIHNEIIESIKDGTIINNIYKSFGEDLTDIAFWGTEPTLTLQYITDKLECIFDTFPKLNRLMFSSNMLSNTDRIYSYLDKLNYICNKKNREIKMHIQLSLDGPMEITDVNRRDNSTEIIVNNILNLIKYISNIIFHKKFSISLGFKPTMSMENLDFFINQNGIIKYFDFFENVLKQMHETLGKTEHVKIHLGCSPTLMVPGMYTKEDGILYAKYVELSCKQKIEDLKNKKYKYVKGEYVGYINDMMETMYVLEEINHRACQTTCSAGDSNIAIDQLNNFHLCHNSFNYTSDDYMNSIYQSQDTSFDVCNFDMITNKFIIDNYIVNAKDKYNTSRLMTVTRGFHDFNTLKISYTKMLIKELALSSQADKEYLTDDNLTTLLAIFLNKRFSCPYNNLVSTKSIHHMGFSVVRLFANGAFKNIMNHIDYINNKGYRGKL